jgi:predicted acyltransferase
MTENKRVGELDVLRGFAVAVMILVTSPGSWAFTYPQMQHADWHGWRFADLVFPDFLFGVGMALGLTFARAWLRQRTPYVLG